MTIWKCPEPGCEFSTTNGEKYLKSHYVQKHRRPYMGRGAVREPDERVFKCYMPGCDFKTGKIGSLRNHSWQKHRIIMTDDEILMHEANPDEGLEREVFVPERTLLEAPLEIYRHCPSCSVTYEIASPLRPPLRDACGRPARAFVRCPLCGDALLKSSRPIRIVMI
jgi:hypothetical protein